MRIIAGEAGGRHLVGPNSDRTRPTADKVREAIFSILGDLQGAVVVDGFAGTGALGLEALSRGAEICYFFEPSRKAIAIIEENVAIVGVEDRAKVFRSEFVRGLREEIRGTPDLWFLDPPYNTPLAREGLEAMAGAEEIVTAGALVVVETSIEEPIFEVSGFQIADEREYGSTRVVFYRRIEGPEDDS